MIDIYKKSRRLSAAMPVPIPINDPPPPQRITPQTRTEPRNQDMTAVDPIDEHNIRGQRIATNQITAKASNPLTHPTPGGGETPLPALDFVAGIDALTKLGPHPRSICWAAATYLELMG